MYVAFAYAYVNCEKRSSANEQCIIESVYVTCAYAYVTSEKTSTANEQYITESVYVAWHAYVTSEKTSTANEQYITDITESVYVACTYAYVASESWSSVRDNILCMAGISKQRGHCIVGIQQDFQTIWQ